MTGKIVRLTDKGFGFITPDEACAEACGGKDVFFHASATDGVSFDELNEGDAVSFTLEDGPKGPSATGVMRTGEAAPEAEAPEAPMAA